MPRDRRKSEAPIYTIIDLIRESFAGEARYPVGSRLQLTEDTRVFKAFEPTRSRSKSKLTAGSIVIRIHGLKINGKWHYIPVRTTDGSVWFIRQDTRVEKVDEG